MLLVQQKPNNVGHEDVKYTRGEVKRCSHFCLGLGLHKWVQDQFKKHNNRVRQNHRDMQVCKESVNSKLIFQNTVIIFLVSQFSLMCNPLNQADEANHYHTAGDVSDSSYASQNKEHAILNFVAMSSKTLVWVRLQQYPILSCFVNTEHKEHDEIKHRYHHDRYFSTSTYRFSLLAVLWMISFK